MSVLIWIFLELVGAAMPTTEQYQSVSKALSGTLKTARTPTTEHVNLLLVASGTKEAFLAELEKHNSSNCSQTLRAFANKTLDIKKDALFTAEFDAAEYEIPSTQSPLEYLLEEMQHRPSGWLEETLKTWATTEEKLFLSAIYHLVKIRPEFFTELKPPLTLIRDVRKPSLIRRAFFPFAAMALTFIGVRGYDYFTAPKVPVAPSEGYVSENKTPAPLAKPAEEKKEKPAKPVAEPAVSRFTIHQLQSGKYKLATLTPDKFIFLHDSMITRAEYVQSNGEIGLKIFIQPPDEKFTIEYNFLTREDAESFRPDDKRLPADERSQSSIDVGSLKVLSSESFEIHPRVVTPETPILKFELRKK